MDLEKLEVVVCRPAQEKDTAQVMELSSHIWEGGDYLPQVWDEWLADTNGLLGVAEFKGRVAGVFKLTKFQDDEWYMEGLRVHPDFQGMGVASHIHNYVLDSWRKMGRGIIRLTTGSYNVKVHRMCDESGFRRIAEFIPYRAAVSTDVTFSFEMVKTGEAQEAMNFVSVSASHALSSGLINLGWVFANLQLKHIEDAISAHHAWWWRERRGFISIWEDEEDDDRSPGIQLIGCQPAELESILRDYRNLMAASGYSSVGWVAPNHPEVIAAVERSSFERSWDVSLYIYELKE